MLGNVNKKIVGMIIVILLLFPILTFAQEVTTGEFNNTNYQFVELEGKEGQYIRQGADTNNSNTLVYSLVNTSNNKTIARPVTTVGGNAIRRINGADGNALYLVRDTRSDDYYPAYDGIAADTEIAVDINGVPRDEQGFIDRLKERGAVLRSAGFRNFYNIGILNSSNPLQFAVNVAQVNFSNFRYILTGQEGVFGRIYRESDIKCDISEYFSLCFPAKFVVTTMLVPSANLLAISGMFFDLVFVNTVVDMGLYIASASGGIEIGWLIFRDISNIIFIFILLYIAINTIIRGVGSTGKSIAWVIVAAILINFSLFFTKVLVDVSNTAAISLYNSAVQSSSRNATLPSALQNRGIESSVAGSLIAKVQIASIYNNTDREKDYKFLFIHGLAGTALQVFLALILFTMSLLFLSRFLTLIILMVTSSLAFGSLAFPKLKAMFWNRWTSELTSQLIMPVAFFTFLLVGFLVLESPLIQSAGFSDLTRPEPQSLLVYGMAMYTLMMAIKYSLSISKGASKHFLKGGGKVAGLAIGASSILGKRAIGWTGRQLADSDLANKNNVYSRALSSFSDKLVKNNFDIRSNKGYQSLIKTVGLDTGTATKGGYDQIQKARAAKVESDYKRVGQESSYERGVRDAYNKIIIRDKDNNDLKEQKRWETVRMNLEKQLQKETDITKVAQLEKEIKDAESKAKASSTAYISSLTDKDRETMSTFNSKVKDAAKNRQKEFVEKASEVKLTKKKPSVSNLIVPFVLPPSFFSDAHKNFAAQQRAKSIKVKKPNDELINALKQSKGSSSS